MSTLSAHVFPLGIGLAIASAGSVLERVGYEHPFETSLGAALLAAGVTLFLRSTASWLQPD
jgi:predicted MFS family arabinose efflux permease